MKLILRLSSHHKLGFFLVAAQLTKSLHFFGNVYLLHSLLALQQHSTRRRGFCPTRNEVEVLPECHFNMILEKFPYSVLLPFM